MEKEVSKYLRDLGIPVSTKYCEKLILSHPDYPAIVCIADLFDRLGIEYMIGRKPVPELEDLTFPFLVHVEPSHIVYIKSKHELESVKKEFQRLSGVAIKIEENSNAINDPGHRKFLSNEKIRIFSGLLAAFSLAIVILISIVLGDNLQISVLILLTAGAGIFVSTLLKIKELGFTLSHIDEFCARGTNSDCDTVLDSAGSKVLGVLSLTDLGMSFFATQLISLVVASQLPHVSFVVLSFLGLACVLSVPVILYSIYYQWLVLRKWCKLCLIVTSIIALQVLIFLFYQNWNYNVLLFDFSLVHIYMILVFVFILSAIRLQSSILEELKDLDDSDTVQKRISNSPGVFLSMLSREPKLVSKESNLDLRIGSAEAEITLTFAFSLFCKPCKQAYDYLCELLEVFEGRVNAIIRFSKTQGVEESTVTVDQYITDFWFKNIHGSPDEFLRTKLLIKDWYANMDFSEFKKKYKLQREEEVAPSVKCLLSDNLQWFIENKVTQTPTVFFCDRRLPASYGLKQLINLLAFISEGRANTSKLVSDVSEVQ